jgi:hypothetical protein
MNLEYFCTLQVCKNTPSLLVLAPSVLKGIGDDLFLLTRIYVSKVLQGWIWGGGLNSSLSSSVIIHIIRI